MPAIAAYHWAGEPTFTADFLNWAAKMPKSGGPTTWQFGLRTIFTVISALAVILGLAHALLDEATFLGLVAVLTAQVFFAVATYCLVFVIPMVIVIWLERRKTKN